jgi:hypothetical protein
VADDTHDERVDGIILAYLEEVDAGRDPDRAALLARHPDLAEELTAFFADQDRVARLVKPALGETTVEASAADENATPAAVGGYRLLRLLGSGGMGRVYEAEGPGGQRVAIKLLSPGIADSPTALQRFREEGRLASRVAHPRCVFVRTADEDAGRPYIVMELMSGVTLKDLVEGTGPLPPADAVARILDISEGLEEAHHAGVLHRDVKPANCYLDADGRVKVGDFGLSRSLVGGSHLTRTGGFVGTPLFASPEQLKGERLDGRTDVYSVAATLYYLLTGQAPFQHSDGATVIARVVSEPAPSPRRLRPDIPPALEEAVLRGLERQRERRYPDLAALREALLPMLPGQMSIAGLGLRFGAYLLDSLPFMVMGQVVGVFSLKGGLFFKPWMMLALTAPYFFYYWLSEGLWGRSVAKWLLRLAVTRAGSWERPGPDRALLRTAVFVATGGLLPNLFIGRVADLDSPALLGAYSFVGAVLSLAARFSTMRARNGYRGLHELLSGTRVVQLPAAPRLGRRCGEPGGPELHTCDVTAPGCDRIPEQVGAFMIRGLLWRRGEEMLLSGDDPTLGRRVWVWWRSPTAAPLSPTRRDLTRWGRLRWLSTGAADEGRWDAFVAPEGTSLGDAVAASGPLGWAATRLILEGLADELAAARADGTQPPGLSIEQVWLTPSGRAQLLDWPLAAAPAPDAHCASAGADEPVLALMRQAAVLALEGQARSYGDDGRPVPAIVPLHARTILARLTGGANPYRALDDVRADLARTATRPVEVTPVLRAFHLAISFCFVAVGVFMMLAWSRNGVFVRTLSLDREMLHAQALREVLRSESLSQPLLAGLTPDDPLRTRAEEQCRLLDQVRIRDSEEQLARLASLGWLESVAHMMPPLRLRTELAGADEPLRLTLRPDASYAVEVVRVALPEEGPWVLDAGDLREVASRARSDPPYALPEHLWPALAPILVTLAIVPLLLVVAALCFRGGLSLHLAGLALVRSDGRDALRLQSAWRVLVVWLPFMAALLPIVWIDLRRTDLLWSWPILQGLAVLFLVVNGALALRFPRRSLSDWLAGTYVVPR